MPDRHGEWTEAENAEQWALEREYVAAAEALEARLYYLAWCDPDGTEGTEDGYQTLPEVTERGQDYQREVEAHGNPCGRRYEVRERVYGRVVVYLGQDHCERCRAPITVAQAGLSRMRADGAPAWCKDCCTAALTAARGDQ